MFLMTSKKSFPPNYLKTNFSLRYGFIGSHLAVSWIPKLLWIHLLLETRIQPVLWIDHHFILDRIQVLINVPTKT